MKDFKVEIFLGKHWRSDNYIEKFVKNKSNYLDVNFEGAKWYKSPYMSIKEYHFGKN